MSIVTTGGIGVGFDIDQLSVGDLFFYDFSSLTGTTVFRVFDDALNYTEFTGTGFSATGIPGPLTDVTAGIIQTCTVVRQGVVILQITGANISAPAFFDAYVANDTLAAWNLALGGDDTINGTSLDDVLRGFGGNDEIKGGDGTDTLYGGAGNDNLRGDEGGNFNQGNDQMFGEAGNDQFKGGAGNDHIDGGADSDTVRYDLETTFTGDDATHGVIVNLSNTALTGVTVTGIPLTNVAAHTAVDTRNYVDTLIAIEAVEGTGYNDLLVGDDNDNELIGNEGNDTLRGNGGNDYFNGGAGNDSMNGGTGDNFYEAGQGTDTIIGGTLNADGEWDKISYEREAGAHGIVATYSGGGAVSIVDTFGTTDTGTGIDEIKGSIFADVFNGSAGNDNAEGMGGGDTFNMGAGWDRVSYVHETDAGAVHGVIVNMSGASVSANIGDGLFNVLAGKARDSFGATDTLVDVEFIQGTQFTDYIVGSAVDNELQGGNGADTLFGGGGNDNLRGDEGGNFNQGNDQMFGEAGDDQFKGGAGADLIDGGADLDTVRYDLETTFTGDDATHGVIVNLSTSVLANVTVTGIPLTNVAAGRAIDTRNFVDTLVSIEDVHATGYNDILVGGSENNLFDGDGGNDGLYSGAGNDELNGGDGNDTLNGGTGIDAMTGGTGNDLFYADNVLDTVFESVGGGVDRINALVSYVLAAGQEIETLSTSNNAGLAAINLTGNEFGNTLTGNAGANVLNGGSGIDTLYGLNGNDSYTVDNALDRVIDAAGGGIDRVYTSVNFTLGAGQEIETLSTTNNAGTAAIKLTGNSFDNILIGNAGANFLLGGLGNDTLTGLNGADTFVFNTALNAATNHDTITDFNVAADTIQLENAIFTLLTVAGTLAAGLFKDLSLAAQDANDIIVYNRATGDLFYDTNGLTAGGQTLFADVTNGTVLTFADFVVV